jgi:hypothetical protein
LAGCLLGGVSALSSIDQLIGHQSYKAFFFSLWFLSPCV